MLCTHPWYKNWEAREPEDGQDEQHRPFLTAQQLPALVGKWTRVSPGWQRHQCFAETVTRESQIMKSSCPTCVSICNLPSVWFSCIH